MILNMHSHRLKTVEEIRSFLSGATTFDFEPQSRKEAYRWVRDSLRQLRYSSLGKADRGAVREYLQKVTGLSRAQVTRLIRQYQETGGIRDRRGRPANAFTRRYTEEDAIALAKMDALHGDPCGPAARKLCERAWQLDGDARYERLAKISNGHLYNLRKTRCYKSRRRRYEKTRPTRVGIGERRKPRPEGRPGFLRIDTVHQGDLDGVKGVYHINAVDEVTQWQVAVSVEKISESYLLPALDRLLDAFPFVILGFHSDNGSEYINRRVAWLLGKLRAEQTRSRPGKSNDNALVEGKNGSVIRKHMGYEHISQRFAGPVNDFLLGVLTPYLNYHRPCLFAEERIDPKGKRTRRYPYDLVMTPWEKLRSLPDAAQYLKPGVTLEGLDAISREVSDNEAARRVKKARGKLFQLFNTTRNHAA